MSIADTFIALKILHIGSLIFWLGPSLGAWFILMAMRKQIGEITPATHLAYRVFIRMLILEHVAFVTLIASGIAMATLVFGFNQPWLQWKLLIILLLIIPLEILDIWYGNIKLPQIFSHLNEAGYDTKQTRTLRIYHTYVTRIAIAIIPVSVLGIMWLVIAKPTLANLW
ncbi:DUF2269 family protein [Cellvibrio fontiphilus]|uniref:DUF2269 family protein n=1 Tax=Cellvibrio fontiphilus TaxID=1815559 RepID=A0ABV7FHM3_9GAMM